MKKYLKITSLGITLFVIGLFGFSKIDANALADPNDIFTIVSPAPNSKVSGTANISVRIYDDEQAAVYVQSNLFDRETCNTTNYGTVSSISTLSSNPGQNSTISWNTTNVNDGTYCLKLCASFVNGGEGYSVCNGREVQVVNNNSLPTITSQLNKTQYIEGESFSYQLTASDPDGDSLTYRLVAAPEILTINPQNGLITSGALSTFGYPGLEYTVTVGVSDGISGEVTQNFKFSVVKPTPPPTTIPDNNQPTTPDTQVPDNQTPDDQTPDETDVITDTDIENGLNFTQPIADTVFTDEQNLIKWTLPNGVELESLSLEYSTDGEEWLLISDSIEPTRTYYFWDMSELQDGKYYVRITIETKDGRKFVKQSEQFEVNIDPNNDGDTIESAPLIINVMPENDSEITDTIISLTGDLLPSEAAEINTDSFVIKLDDNDITSTCEVTQENFSCSLENELDLGRHLVNVSVGDSSEQTATLEWTFSIVEAQTTDNSSTNNDSSTVVIFGREIPRSGVILLGIILCIGGALLLIPWILYSIWSGRDSDSSSSSDSGSDGTAIENNYDFSSTDYSVPSTTDLPSIDSYSDSSTSTSSDYSSIPSYDPNTSYDINSAGTDYSYTPPSSDSNSYTDYTVGNSSSTESTQPETASVMPEMPSLDSSATNSTNTEGNQNSSDNFVEPQQTS